MFQQDVVVVNTPEEFEAALARFLADVIPASTEPVAGPFDTHAANLESLADAIEAGRHKIATGSEIPDQFTTDDVSEELVQNDADLANAAGLMVEALRVHAADWRKAGASI